MPAPSAEDIEAASEYAPKNNCTIFLGYTSNMASCGVRETIRFLVQHKMVDCIVWTPFPPEYTNCKIMQFSPRDDIVFEDNKIIIPCFPQYSHICI